MNNYKLTLLLLLSLLSSCNTLEKEAEIVTLEERDKLVEKEIKELKG